MKGLMVMLVIGIMTAHVPLLVLARMPADDCAGVESCGTCQCDSDAPVAGQGSPGEPGVASSLKHPEPEIPDEEPCCADVCNHCSLPCCGGVTLSIAPPTTLSDFPVTASTVTIANNTFTTIEVTDVFRPPRS